ncbi:hypothetical protein KGQ24_01665 [Patescibacteria group bacterium]|nr:hypothetical protein [Patescibacteria group bacterium]
MNQQPMQQPMGQGQMMQQPGRSSRMPWIVLVVVVIIVLGVLAFLFRGKFSQNANAPKLSGYQAVFLTNGQVYFGKISDVRDTYVKLSDIYYLQVNQNLQSGQTATQQQSANSNQQPQLSLVKLGQELHGPADEMYINRSQILFYEDMKADGQVAQAIAQYQKNGGQAPAATNQQGTAPATNAPEQPAATTPAPAPAPAPAKK